MGELEEKIGNILNNPQMMQQILSMAQAMGSTPQEAPPPPPPQNEPLPNIDMDTVRKISALAQSAGIDRRERALLQALEAYLSRERLGKLEKAMRAAKMAKLASASFSSSGR